MNFVNAAAELYIPDGDPAGIKRATHLCVAAHQDDVEIMAYAPIAECYNSKDKFFASVTLTDGAGSPRTGKFAHMTDEEMKKVRAEEQKNAARLGRYCAAALLAYPSSEIKRPGGAAKELQTVFCEAQAEYIYLHNLADKHDTHVAAALRCIEALRNIKSIYRPKKIIMLEVWRGLDWLCDEDKLLLDTSPYPKLAASLLDVYESQIAGGKSYRNAALGRRYANATFLESHSTDKLSSVSYGMDVTDFVYSDLSPASFIAEYIKKLEQDVMGRIERLS